MFNNECCFKLFTFLYWQNHYSMMCAVFVFDSLLVTGQTNYKLFTIRTTIFYNYASFQRSEINQPQNFHKKQQQQQQQQKHQLAIQGRSIFKSTYKKLNKKSCVWHDHITIVKWISMLVRSQAFFWCKWFWLVSFRRSRVGLSSFPY